MTIRRSEPLDCHPAGALAKKSPTLLRYTRTTLAAGQIITYGSIVGDIGEYMKTHWLKLTVWSIAISAGCVAVTLLLVAHTTSAAPASGGAILTVNTPVDSYVAGDGVLSLRKAMSVANGLLSGP